jgi:RHS repeat-associated protein
VDSSSPERAGHAGLRLRNGASPRHRHRNGSLTASYTDDLNGNRATKVTSGGTMTATVDDQDRLVSYGGASYAYTAHGDVSRKVVGTDTTFYTYDALGNLTQVRLPDGTAIGYLLDPQNRRIGQTVNDTLVKAWLYQGQLTPVAELDGTGAVVSRFVYATGVNVPDYLVRGDSTYRLIRDHLGSVRLVVNVASGTIAQRVSYDEYGIETENTAPGWQPFGYAGGLTDSQTGLVRFGARDYDPVAGRWTAKDPIGFAGGTTGLYEYAESDPINLVDPSGESAFACILDAGLNTLIGLSGIGKIVKELGILPDFNFFQALERSKPFVAPDIFDQVGLVVSTASNAVNFTYYNAGGDNRLEKLERYERRPDLKDNARNRRRLQSLPALRKLSTAAAFLPLLSQGITILDGAQTMMECACPGT